MKGQAIAQKYIVVKVLGQDSCCETFLARGKGKNFWRNYAIKKFRPILGNPQAKIIKKLFYREASMLRLLSGHHPQIPQLYECFLDGEDFYIVREWIAGKTLQQQVKQRGRFSEVEVRQILNSILSVLQYIHKYGIVYRQLNPSSIVLRRNHWSNRSQNPAEYLPVPIYFGGVKELTAGLQHLDRGGLVSAACQEYISPEQEQGNSVCISDLYSLGLTAIYLLTGKTPGELNTNIYTNRLLWEREAPNLSSNLVRVINRAICPDPSDRFSSAEAMLKALNSQLVSLNPSVLEPSESRVSKAFQSLVASEARIVSVLSSLSLGIVALTFAILNLDLQEWSTAIDNGQLATRVELKNLLPNLNQTLHLQPRASLGIPAFTVGTPQAEVTDYLGEPTQAGLGYGGKSLAFYYQDFVPQKVDLAYVSDWTTQTIRQTEVLFADSVRPVEIETTLEQLLTTEYSPEIAQKLEKVISEESDRQIFSVNNVQGVIKRNPQNNGIHLAVWQRNFYQ